MPANINYYKKLFFIKAAAGFTAVLSLSLYSLYELHHSFQELLFIDFLNFPDIFRRGYFEFRRGKDFCSKQQVPAAAL
jgi:hypothetical protein